MTWQTAVAVGSAFISLAVFLGGALGRETVGELKRRVGILETRDDTRAREVAALDERSKGQTEALKRIEAQMVPRNEWESRHQATDDRLEHIIQMLRDRDSAAHLDPPPRRKG